VEGLERADAEVRAIAGNLGVAGVDREAPLLTDLDLEVEAEGGGEDVEAGAEVGRGGRHADQPTAAGHGLIST
jgi:hypothetical protein